MDDVTPVQIQGLLALNAKVQLRMFVLPVINSHIKVMEIVYLVHIIVKLVIAADV